MYNPKLRPPMASYEITKQDEGSSSCCTLRCWLLVWAFLRLAATVLWYGVQIIATAVQFLPVDSRDPPRDILFGTVAIVVQVVEIGMIVTFITAGFKKSASLYRAYYRYCILTLIIYIIAVIQCFILDYQYGHYFAEMYLSYHFDEFSPIIGNDALIFAVVAISNICLEILLICLVKKMINKYNVYA